MENPNINPLDNIQDEIAKNVQDFMDNLCPSCGGTGKIKAFQSMAFYDGPPIKRSVSIPCTLCKGTGVYKKG